MLVEWLARWASDREIPSSNLDAGGCHTKPKGNFLRNDAHSQVCRTTKPFIPSGINRLVPDSAEGYGPLHASEDVRDTFNFV